MDVVIRGDGVAAYCCAHLLARAGFGVTLEPAARPRLPVVLLGHLAITLIRDIFEKPALFQDSPRIEKRIVAWGPGATPATLPHSAVLVTEELLLDSLRPGSVSSNQLGPRWTIHATRPLPERSLEHHFGSRVATVIPVELLDSADSSTCAMESFDDGWLFLIPSAPNSGWLLALGAPALHMLSRSQTIAASVSKLGPPTGEFPAYPRIASPLCGPDWLACGTAAMAFDPICGDGTGHAIREAILASAVIQALAKGAPPDDLSAHYEARLTAAFRRHLLLCREFYSTAGSSPLWTSETAAIDRGIQWCDAKLGPQPSFRYQLRGFELEAVR